MHLLNSKFDDKENVPPMQRKVTKENGTQKMGKEHEWKHNQKEEGMVIRSCDGSLAAYYVMKDNIFKIGRSHTNVVRSL